MKYSIILVEHNYRLLAYLIIYLFICLLIHATFFYLFNRPFIYLFIHSLILQLVDPADVKNEAERIASDGDKYW